MTVVVSSCSKIPSSPGIDFCWNSWLRWVNRSGLSLCDDHDIVSAEESRGGRVTLVRTQTVCLIRVAYARHLHIRIVGATCSLWMLCFHANLASKRQVRQEATPSDRCGRVRNEDQVWSSLVIVESSSALRKHEWWVAWILCEEEKVTLQDAVTERRGA